MLPKKLLSIVIPTYNMEKYLRKCLDSLVVSDKYLKQLDVLVINDGSKDSSSLIAHEYESRFPDTFRVIDKGNGNYGSCINRGISEACGLYFRILDADDSFDTQALEALIDVLSSGDASEVVFTNFKMVDPNGKCISYKETTIPEGVHNFGEIDFIGTSNEHLLTMHCITYRTDYLRSSGLHQQEGISYTDVEYCYFPLIEARSFCYIDLILYFYLVGREGQTVSVNSSLKHFRDYDLVGSRILADYLERYNSLLTPKKKLLSKFVYFPILNIYLINLVYRKSPNKAEYEKMLEINKKVRSLPYVLTLLRKTKYYRVYFYRIWELFHFRIGLICGKK